MKYTAAYCKLNKVAISVKSKEQLQEIYNYFPEFNVLKIYQNNNLYTFNQMFKENNVEYNSNNGFYERNDYEIITAYQFLNDNKMKQLKTLPKVFGIKRDANNPLWGKYIGWGNSLRNSNYSGNHDEYYGIKMRNYFDNESSLEDFNNIELTLEEWDSIINLKEEWLCPEKWYIPVTEENKEVLSKWRLENCTSHINNIPLINHAIISKHQNDNSLLYGEDVKYFKDNHFYKDYQEITFAQFKEHVLKTNNKETMKNKKIIGYKIIEDYPNADGLKKGHSVVTNEVIWKGFIFYNQYPQFFEPVFADEKIMLDGSKYEITFVSNTINSYAIIDSNAFNKEFWQAAKIIAEHSKASITLGCDAKGLGSNQWKVSLETIQNVIDRLQ